MTYAFVQDIASSWEQYERVAAGLTEPTLDGLILHLAGPTDEGLRIIDVWESEQAFKRFQVERLQPAVAALGGRSRRQPTFRDLHPAHLVIGSIGSIQRAGDSPATRITHVHPHTRPHRGHRPRSRSAGNSDLGGDSRPA